MSASERLLDELAVAVLDGGAVDWADAESSADPQARALVRHLRLVASVARLHRDLEPTITLPADDLPATSTVDRWGHLRLLERVGGGAFGEVFRAWDTRLDREVALKLLHAPAAGRDAGSSIIQEGRLLARVRHPNVVTIYGAEQIGDETGLWMEFIRGRTLEHMLQQGTTFSARESVEIGLELCSALSAVHAAGLLHRDIKAHNVMKADDGRIVLMDFGAGREFDALARDLTGTPLYLAPEVLRGDHATTRSDIYSLGVLLFHLVTGSYPVSGRTLAELRSAHERGEANDLKNVHPDLPPKLKRVIARAISPQPSARYPSADAFARDLSALLPRARVVRWARGLGAAAAIALVAGAAWELRARQTGSPTRPSVLIAGLVGVPTTAERYEIAVLPFRKLGIESGSDDLADGLTIGLIQQLAAIDGLQVKSQRSSFMFKESPRDLQAVLRELGANLLVEGTVQLSGDRLRVNAQLVRAGNDVVWLDHFDRQLTSAQEVFAIQDDIARAIVNALRLKLGRGQRRYETRLTLPRYMQYVKAQTLQARGTAKAAAVLYQEIVDSTPDFAPAWAGLASSLAQVARVANPETGLPTDQDVERVRAAASKAIDLDPLLAEAQAALGAVFAHDRDWPQAEAAYERALQSNSSRTLTHTDFVFSTLMPQGKQDEALRLLTEAHTIDPLSLDVMRTLANVQVDSGRYDEAIASCQWVMARDPKFPYVEGQLARALALSGKHDEALASLEQQPGNWGVVGYVYARMGRRDEAEALAAKRPDLPGRQMQVYSGLGDKDRTFDALERLGDVNWWLAAYLMQRPEMAFARDDPRFAEIRKKLRLPPL